MLKKMYPLFFHIPESQLQASVFSVTRRGHPDEKCPGGATVGIHILDIPFRSPLETLLEKLGNISSEIAVSDSVGSM